MSKKEEFLAKYGSDEDVNVALKSPLRHIRHVAINNVTATPENIHTAMKSTDFELRLHAVRHSNVSRENIEYALDDNTEKIRKIAEGRLKEFK